MIVNPKGEMKGSAISGPVAKECVCFFIIYLGHDHFSDKTFSGRSMATYRLECRHSCLNRGFESSIRTCFFGITNLRI